jgi:hypothetical protein
MARSIKVTAPAPPPPKAPPLESMPHREDFERHVYVCAVYFTAIQPRMGLASPMIRHEFHVAEYGSQAKAIAAARAKAAQLKRGMVYGVTEAGRSMLMPDDWRY